MLRGYNLARDSTEYEAVHRGLPPQFKHTTKPVTLSIPFSRYNRYDRYDRVTLPTL